jgi:molybdenum cofactor synthesis domain-containing protein
MDGYAVRASDLTRASKAYPAKLRISEATPLGKYSSCPLANGEARRVLTGGYLPVGADAVLQAEAVEKVGRLIVVKRPVQVDSFVFRRGADVTAGHRVLQKGQLIRAQDVGLAVSLRISRLSVFRKPVVAVVPTGDELTARLRDVEPGKVIESHTYVLSWLVRAAGGEAINMGIARDSQASIAPKLKEALRSSEIVLTIAGSSVGDRDLVERAINRVGKPGVVVHGVKIHRGRVVGFGLVGRKPIIILPGPIQGMLNAFSTFVYPLIRAHLGQPFRGPPTVRARLSSHWEVHGPFANFTKILYVKRSTSERGIEARPLVGETEKITLLTSADGYVLVPEEVTALKAGTKVDVCLLPGFSGDFSG